MSNRWANNNTTFHYVDPRNTSKYYFPTGTSQFTEANRSELTRDYVSDYPFYEDITSKKQMIVDAHVNAAFVIANKYYKNTTSTSGNTT